MSTPWDGSFYLFLPGGRLFAPAAAAAFPPALCWRRSPRLSPWSPDVNSSAACSGVRASVPGNRRLPLDGGQWLRQGTSDAHTTVYSPMLVAQDRCILPARAPPPRGPRTRPPAYRFEPLHAKSRAPALFPCSQRALLLPKTTGVGEKSMVRSDRARNFIGLACIYGSCAYTHLRFCYRFPRRYPVL